MPIIIPAPAPGVENESWILDGLALNDGVTLTLESISDPVAPKIAEWVKGADSDGALLARPPKHELKIIEMKLRVESQATKDAALAHIGSVLDKLQECEQNTLGLPLVWDPANSTAGPITWRALLGEITDLPKDLQDSGWFLGNNPTFTIRFSCLPFGEGEEYLAGTVTSSAPLITLELADIPGDVPALGRLVTTDAASKDRRYVAWGMESRHYPISSPPSLIVDSSAMTPLAGATATRSGAYSGASNNVISATLRTQLQAICSLPNLSHVGLFRPQLRFYASATTMQIRLTWQALDGPFRSLSYVVPAVAGWNHVDLGSINIPEAALGTQRWTGRIEAYSTATGGETFAVDVIWLMPAEKFGRARASYAYSAGYMTAYDDFTTATPFANLGGRVAPVGGTWATSGAATDFVIGNLLGNLGAIRSAVGTRYAILGTSRIDTEVSASINFGNGERAVIARWVDASNYLRAKVVTIGDGTINPTTGYLQLETVIGGVVTLIVGGLPSAFTLFYGGPQYTLRMVAYASGYVSCALLDGGLVLSSASAVVAAAATGGSLASGQTGVYDERGSGVPESRSFDDYYVGVPAPEPIVCASGQSIEFRSDATLREDATGTYAGSPPSYVGARFTVPNAGGPDRKTRVAVIARRNDIETDADDDLVSNATLDSTTAAVFATPRFLAVPR